MTEDPLLSVVIAAYGAPEHLLETLRSFFGHASLYRYEVIVVDSGGQEHSVHEHVSSFPVTYLAVPNHGFAAATNAGIRQSRGDFVALLNPDVILVDDTVRELVKLLQDDPTIGCAGPTLRRSSGDMQPYAFGWEPTPQRLVCRGLLRLVSAARDSASKSVTPPGPSRVNDVDWVAGTCLVTRRELFASVGLLDERYFLYWEDVDWCLRVKRLGWRVVIHSDVVVTHIGGASVGQTASHHYYRSLVRFYENWYGHAAAVLMALCLAIYAPIAAAVRRTHADRH